MQKITLIAIIAAVLALMPFASAAEAYTLEEFTKINPMQAIFLEEGDMLDFPMLDGVHRIRLKEIAQSETSIKINVYPFNNLGASQAQAVPFFGLDNVIRVDLDQDNEDDVLLDIYEIEDRRVTLVVFSAEYYGEGQANNLEPEITGSPEGQGVVQEKKDYSRTFWALGIAVVALAVFLYVRAIEAKEKKHKPKKEKKED
ncbi:MAG: hypothetical protein PHO02_06640 [Candidatus Nanoarchaeia archaeon]|nr:hypothetical protein [Candidatus Nanoarchaeia archaeon]